MKRTFIPPDFRPNVPGSKIVRSNAPIFKMQSTVETLKPTVVILSSREDVVAKTVWQDLNSEDFAIHLFFDDLGYTWDFTFTDETLNLYTANGKIIPLSIYQRHPGVDESHPFYFKHIALFEVLDIWKENSIGQKRDHFHNTSKPFQTISSILQAIKSTKSNNVGIPKTYLVKGDFQGINKRFKGSLIVKSCSSIRSIVTTDSEFNSWDNKNLNNIPVLFQGKVEGLDYRIHLMDDQLWTLAVTSKDHTDYRYSSKKALEYSSPTLPNYVGSFCKAVSKIENNRFIGIDLIKVKDKYICLESNPGPGWSTFNHPSKLSFSRFFINTLKKRKERIHEQNNSYCIPNI